MSKKYTEQELIDMGMDAQQIQAILSIQNSQTVELENESDSIDSIEKVVQLHEVNVRVENQQPLKATSLDQIASYKNGTLVELPPFADGQPFVARMKRPSMLALVKSGQIPNTLLNQSTSLFVNGAGALNGTGKNSTSINDLFDVIEKIVDAALLEPTLEEIRSVGMELSDDQLMAIFSYTQGGVKALEQFRPKRTNS